MKKNFFAFIWGLSFCVSAFCQNSINREASLLQFGQHFQTYFEQAFKSQYNKSFSSYEEDYRIETAFIIDTFGSPKNIQIDTLNSSHELNEAIFRMINGTQGFWNPKVKNCQKVDSDTINCVFIFLSQQLNTKDRMDRLENDLHKEYFSNLNLKGRNFTNNMIFLQLTAIAK